MNTLSRIGLFTFAACLVTPIAAEEPPCMAEAPGADMYVADPGPSWIFRPGTYTHDPYTGARVAQYMRLPPVEPLNDERMVTSRYRRSRTNLRGVDGSIDTYYEVQAWGNGRGGIDAEWERFHDAWKESFLQGGFYNQGPSYGGYPGWGYGPHHGGYGAPGWGYGHPGYGHGGGFHHGPPLGHGGGHHGPPEQRPPADGHQGKRRD